MNRVCLNLFKKLRTGSTGQGIVEYAFVLMLVALAALFLLQAIGITLTGIFSEVTFKTAP